MPKFKIGEKVICESRNLSTIVVGYDATCQDAYQTYLILGDRGWPLGTTDVQYWNVPSQYLGQKVFMVEGEQLKPAPVASLSPLEDGCHCSGPCKQFYPMAVPNRGDKLVCYGCRAWGH